MESDGMLSKLLRELPNVTARPFLLILEGSWQWESFPWDERKQTSLLRKYRKENLGKHTTVRLTSITTRVMEQIILETISGCMKDQKVIVCSQHGSMKRSSRLTNLTAFWNKASSLVSEARAVDVVYVDFSEAFDASFSDSLVEKLRKYRLSKLTVKWTERWLNCHLLPASNGCPQQ